jgi:Zn-dependent alcohol dehydrogenase
VRGFSRAQKVISYKSKVKADDRKQVITVVHLGLAGINGLRQAAARFVRA